MKVFFAGMATVAVSALGATVLVPGLQTVTMDVAEMAAIDESNTTIGIADSDVYFESPAQMDAALDQMQALGVNTVRVGIPWAGINPIPGYYDWSQSDYLINAADERGMGILAVVTTTPGYAQNGSGIYSEPISPEQYGEFVGLAAERYAGKVGGYEIWNEPNAAPFYGPAPDPAGYTELLQAAYPEIKAADPDATVVGGVVGSTITHGNFTLNPVTFVDQMYDSGAQGYFDALSFHPYQYTMPFSTGGYHPDSPLNQLGDIRDLMVANGDAEKLVWASEYGQPTSVSSDAEQAAYLEDMLTTWRTLDYTGPTFVYTLEDDQTGSTNPEDTFGLIRSDGTWKPAAYIVQDLATSPSTTPKMAQMALAMPEAQEAAPEDLVALAAIAEPMAPTVSTPPLVEPTLVEPVVTEPTLAEPIADLETVRSVELDESSTEPTVQAPANSTPTSAIDQTRSADLDEVSENETAADTTTAGESVTSTEADTAGESVTSTEADTAGESVTSTEADTAGESVTSTDADTSTESATSTESTRPERSEARQDRSERTSTDRQSSGSDSGTSDSGSDTSSNDSSDS